jgi:hypothetical protein
LYPWEFQFNESHRALGLKFIQFTHWAHLRLQQYYNRKSEPFLRGVNFDYLLKPLIRILNEILAEYTNSPPSNYEGLQNVMTFYSNDFFDSPQSPIFFTEVLQYIKEEIEFLLVLTDISSISDEISVILNYCDESFCMVTYFNYFLMPLINYSKMRIDRPLALLELDTFESAKARISKRPDFTLN